MEAASETTTQRPKRRRARKVLLLGLVVVLAVVGGRWVWRQVQFSRLRGPLIEAVRGGDTARVRDLLEQGADPDARVDYIPEPVTWASVTRILRGRRSVPSSKSDTVLMEASLSDHVDIMRLLLDYGADIDAREESGRTALYAAIDGEASAPPNPLDPVGENSVDFLLQKGADVNIQNEEGKTPFLYAVRFFSLYRPSSLLRRLRRYGADLEIRDEEGETALIGVAGMGRLWAVQALLDDGAMPDAQDNEGTTALMIAIQNMPRAGEETRLWHGTRADYLATLHLLIDRGVDLRLRDKQGRTALRIAELGGDPETIALVRKAAARASGAGKGAGH